VVNINLTPYIYSIGREKGTRKSMVELKKTQIWPKSRQNIFVPSGLTSVSSHN